MKRSLLPASWLFSLVLTAQTAPHFEVDPSWPKPLPEGWITGQLGGVCTDSHDHIVVVNRRDITAEEKAALRPDTILRDIMAAKKRGDDCLEDMKEWGAEAFVASSTFVMGKRG